MRKNHSSRLAAAPSSRLPLHLPGRGSPSPCGRPLHPCTQHPPRRPPSCRLPATKQRPQEGSRPASPLSACFNLRFLPGNKQISPLLPLSSTHTHTVFVLTLQDCDAGGRKSQCYLGYGLFMKCCKPREETFAFAAWKRGFLLSSNQIGFRFEKKGEIGRP